MVKRIQARTLLLSPPNNRKHSRHRQNQQNELARRDTVIMDGEILRLINSLPNDTDAIKFGPANVQTNAVIKKALEAVSQIASSKHQSNKQKPTTK